MLKHTKNSSKSIKVAAALEARLQTLEHLNSEEAATMLSRMAPQQASQMVPWSNLFLKQFDVDVFKRMEIMESRNVTESRELLPLAFVIYLFNWKMLNDVGGDPSSAVRKKTNAAFWLEISCQAFQKPPASSLTEWYFCPENVVSL